MAVVQFQLARVMTISASSKCDFVPQFTPGPLRQPLSRRQRNTLRDIGANMAVSQRGGTK